MDTVFLQKKYFLSANYAFSEDQEVANSTPPSLSWICDHEIFLKSFSTFRPLNQDGERMCTSTD